MSISIRFILPAFVVCILAPSNCLGKDERYQAVRGLVDKFKYEEADKLADQHLKKDPNWVDGWMWKGNLVVYQNCMSSGMYVGANPDQSIYDSSLGIIGEQPEPDRCGAETAKKAVSYFQKALDIDPKREDIQMGVCWILSKAGLFEDLIPRLKVLKDKFDGPKLQFNMMDYARWSGTSAGYDAGKTVFEAIVAMYPGSEGDLAGDFAATAMQLQRPDEALKLAARAYGSSQYDAMTAKNIVLVGTLNGDYELGTKAADKHSVLAKNHYGKAYRALLARLKGEKGWKKGLEEYVKNESPEEPEHAFAERYLAVKKETAGDYHATLKDLKDNSLFLLTAEWMGIKYPEAFDPALELADTYSHFKIYGRTIPICEGIHARMKLNPQQRSKCLLRHAWALQDSGKVAEADPVWAKLVDDKDLYARSAACWFLGRNLEKKGDAQKAVEFYQKVSSKAKESKYANYCLNAVNRIKGKK